MNRIQELVGFMAAHLDPEDTDGGIRCVLADLYIRSDMSGYHCLRQALGRFYRDPDQFLTKELYVDVGHSMPQNFPGMLVEKQIRYAISKAWKRRDEEVWKCYFPRDEKPTNGEFIARVVSILYLWQVCARPDEVKFADE